MSFADHSAQAYSLQQIQIVAYVDVCSIALVFYDYFSTFPGEIRFVWSSGWSIVNVFFVISRYGALCEGVLILIMYGYAHPSDSTCVALSRAIDGGQFVCVTAAEFILVFRTWALWERNKRIAMGLAALVTVLLAVVATYATKFEASVQVTLPNPDNPAAFSRCIQSGGGGTISITYACVAILETVVLVLTLIKAPWRFVLLKSHLIRVLYRDGILYYIYSIFNVVTVLSAPPGISHVLLVSVVFAALLFSRSQTLMI
ncbi:uncharacterized protein STEHIDRAFT_156671 [Stereum hirsutum FP-91666 SS1]|uniref:uncharacterized protein n=1 Tax=Stereum hirsutum (strain FP-91666) TaxID=721885 RepID=UPI000440B499|nr:uncharacterized protein STEHIDRAFT_156671 [Stereum hirsutum FP-91666 SS1]EIM86342.1 hypothetical protein STEHIDRAFT_156671 [Stereum hirsutum FP-91666 SS1]